MDPKDVLITFPELLVWFPLISGLFAFSLGEGQKPRNWAMVSSVITLLLSILSLVYSGPDYYAMNHVSYYWLPEIGSSFAFMLDGMGRMLTLLTAIAFPLILFTTQGRQYRNPNLFYGLMLLSQSGLMGVFCAMDALVFYFFWELALIPVYFLASMWGGERRIQAAFKFFIYTFAGSLLLLIGIIYVYLHTPEQSFSLVSFYQNNLTPEQQSWVFWLFFIAFAIKMPIFPVHTWQPDAYEQAPTPVTMVLSGIMVKMGVFAVIRWLLPIFPQAVDQFDNVVIGLSVIGIIYASCVAMVQDDIKRLIAYSSIAHIGLMCAALFVRNTEGLQGVMIQMFNHGLNIIGMWIVVELIEQRTGTRKLSELGGLAQKSPLLAILLVVVALANIALPLTNAFVGEFLMFNGLFKFNFWYTLVAGVSIILAAVYTLNMIQKIFYGEVKEKTASFRGLNIAEGIILSVIVVAIFLVGVYPDPMFQLTGDTVKAIISRVSAL